ncbi:hypothetical protein P3T35_007952 [Kitasatospora sp. GP30]|nr:hypothetical protein [Kitasatospora sp. GP30]
MVPHPMGTEDGPRAGAVRQRPAAAMVPHPVGTEMERVSWGSSGMTGWFRPSLSSQCGLFRIFHFGVIERRGVPVVPKRGGLAETCSRSVAESCTMRGFNGATPGRREDGLEMVAAPDPARGLQRCHTGSVRRQQAVAKDAERALDASTVPHPIGAETGGSWSRWFHGPSGFNSAAPSRCGDGHRGPRSARGATRRFNGAAPDRCGDEPMTRHNSCGVYRLQWCRTRAVRRRPGPEADPPGAVRASTVPLPVGAETAPGRRGARRLRCRPCFNGAAPGRCGDSMPAGLGVYVGLELRRCRTRAVRRQYRGDDLEHHRHDASTVPHRLVRRQSRRGSHSQSAGSRFNGAAPGRYGDGARRSGSTPAPGRFNGAASRSVRRGSAGSVVTCAIPALQRCRTQWVWRQKRPATAQPPKRCGFNGAAPGRCGDGGLRGVDLVLDLPLQWCRTRSGPLSSAAFTPPGCSNGAAPSRCGEQVGEHFTCWQASTVLRPIGAETAAEVHHEQLWAMPPTMPAGGAETGQ